MEQLLSSDIAHVPLLSLMFVVSKLDNQWTGRTIHD
jgi:hypothetical protein